jgi:ribonucleoside-diphosphate reductase alpha chain
MKYRLKAADGTPLDATPDESWWRVARAVAVAEPEADRERWAQSFHDILSGYRYLPAGRILAGAGSARAVTLFNCFVMGAIPDSLPGIFDGLKEAALTMQQGAQGVAP